MEADCTEFGILRRSRLIAYSLGHSDPELKRHLAGCGACQTEVASYQTLLASTRAVLSGHPLDVRFVNCRKVELADGAHCVAEDTEHNLAVILSAQDGVLRGQVLGCGLGCSCWQGAVVRLFGGQGFVASSPVDSSGAFVLSGLRPGQRYTVALVSNEDDHPQLRIIGQFPP